MNLQEKFKLMVDDMSDYDPDEFQKEKEAFLRIHLPSRMTNLSQ